jgi:hypothetical protein
VGYFLPWISFARDHSIPVFPVSPLLFAEFLTLSSRMIGLPACLSAPLRLSVAIIIFSLFSFHLSTYPDTDDHTVPVTVSLGNKICSLGFAFEYYFKIDLFNSAAPARRGHGPARARYYPGTLMNTRSPSRIRPGMWGRERTYNLNGPGRRRAGRFVQSGRT